jgi:hypothetical protein
MGLSFKSIAMIGVLAAVVGHAETQTWTATNGRSIEGDFVRLFGSTVTIKRPNGMQISVQLSSLDEKSREQAKALAGQGGGGKTAQTGGFKVECRKPPACRQRRRSKPF